MKKIHAFIILSTLIAMISGVQAQQRKSSDKPNIVFILADDMGYGDAGCYGQKKIKTPNIDRLAETGERFTQMYSGSPVCAPSRASLMTGKTTGHSYIRGNGEVALRDQDTTLPQLLQNAGYATGMFGKWGLGLSGTSGEPWKKGWNKFVGHMHHMEGHFQHGDSLWFADNGKAMIHRFDRDTFYNEVFTEEALKFIDNNQSKPFFIYLSYTLPHAELRIQQRYLQQYMDANGQSIFAPEVAQPEGFHYRSQPFTRAAYAAMISAMDDYVGRVMQELKRLNLDKNTLVIFASDNGTHIEGGRTKNDAVEYFKSSGPLKGIKRDLTEGGIRVPFVVNWPGTIKPGKVNTQPAAFWDLYTTFSNLAGIKTDPHDGIDITASILKQKKIKHPPFYWEFDEGGFRQAVREGDWKIIRYWKDGAPDRIELYNLAKDIHEDNNLAEKYPEKCKEMVALLESLRTESEHPNWKLKKPKNKE